MSRVAFPAFAFLLLAACNDNSPVAKEARQDSPPESAVMSGDKSPTVVDRRGAGVIPAPLHGLWAMTPADCDRPTGGAEAFIEVRGGELRFQDKTGWPTADAQTTDRSISGNFAFQEGSERSTRFQSLQLRDEKLIRTESDPMRSYTYARCR
ncbi:MAG TPA: hypothetical protein VM346_11660 [Sphingomicrobium sp.]|nr:hypothetical protein [Sphingomicrobium sp.]